MKHCDIGNIALLCMSLMNGGMVTGHWKMNLEELFLFLTKIKITRKGSNVWIL